MFIMDDEFESNVIPRSSHSSSSLILKDFIIIMMAMVMAMMMVLMKNTFVFLKEHALFYKSINFSY